MSSPVGPRNRAWRFLRVALVLLGLTALVVAALSLAWPGQSQEAPPPDSLLAAPQLPSPVPATPAPAAAVATATSALPVRLVVPGIGVDAPVTVRSVDPTGLMQNPDGATDVAWYDFTARPGQGGNAVFSGHLDYHDYGPAVFARLAEVKPGDVVEVRLENGTLHRYAVSVSVLYPADSAPSQEIVGPTDTEVATLITCTGAFNRAQLEYADRLVVRAERVS